MPAEEAAARKKRQAAIAGPRKAAIFLMTMAEQSADILRHLSEEEIQKIGREVAMLGLVGSEQVETVLEEYVQLTLAQEYLLEGGVPYAKKMISDAFGQETASKIIDLMMKKMGQNFASLDALQKADPQQLARLIHNESPQTIALILSHLVPSQSAALLASLPDEARPDVVIRMAGLEQFSSEIVGKIAAVIGEKLAALGEFSREASGGLRAVAETLNRLDSNLSDQILQNVSAHDNGLAENIRRLMFVFEDLLKVDKEGMRALTSKVDRKSLTLAMKGTSEALRRHFMQVMSERG
ncbi:MAG: flagellar motor switch protein FliG, partial [Acidobacteria bacterium]|nr:flagellar motor switch protein FliG [Acidobacteriota bacterium]